MPATETHRLLFRDKFRSLHHQAFQSWFEELARVIYRGGAFLPVRLANGDAALDGLLVNSGQVFQVFAPARVTEMRDSQTANKINRDFARAHGKLGVGGIRSWTFLHNHPEARLGPKSVTAIYDLKRKHETIHFSVLDIDSLWDLVRELPTRRLDTLLGAATEKNTTSTKVDALLKNQKDTNERVERLLCRLELEQHVPKEALRSILVAFGESNVPDEELIERLRAKAVEYRTLLNRLDDNVNIERRVGTLRQSVRKALLVGDFEQAEAALTEAQANRPRSSGPPSPGQHAAARSEAEIILFLAAIAELRSEYERAASLYRQASDAASGDARVQRDSRRGEARSLVHYGSQRGVAQSVRRGVQIYRELLTDPVGGAGIREIKLELASALVTLGQLDSSEVHIEEAIRLYSDVLRDCQRDPLPAAQRSELLNEMAIAQENLGVSRSDPAIIHRSIHTFCEALACLGPDPSRRALIRNNIGNAIAEIHGVTGAYELLQEAISSYEDALTLVRPAEQPDLWATINNNIANVRHAAAKGSKEKSTRAQVEQLWSAVDGFRKALQHWTREQWPVKWSAATMNLGNTLHDIGKSTGDVAILFDAIQCYEEALEESAHLGMPLLSARIRSNFALTLNDIGAGTVDIDCYDRSEQMATEALALWPEGAMPHDWASANLTLGAAIGNNHRGNVDRIRQAIKAFEHALPIFERLGDTGQLLDCLENLLHIHRTLAEFTQDPSDLMSAVKHGERAVSLASNAVQRALMQRELSIALFELGALAKDQSYLVRSERALRKAIPVLVEDNRRAECASAYNNIAVSLQKRLFLRAEDEATDKRSLRSLALKATAALRLAASFCVGGTMERAQADAALGQALGLARALGVRKATLAEAVNCVQAALAVFRAHKDDAQVGRCEELLDLLNDRETLQRGKE